MEKGITLSWLKVGMICFALIASRYGELVLADEKQATKIEAVAVEIKKEVKQVADFKLDKVDFVTYKTEHRRANERMLDKFELEFRNLKTQVSDSEKKIIELLTAQEIRRRNGS
jgi:hypothetical protein